jgi:hypothetical protein
MPDVGRVISLRAALRDESARLTLVSFSVPPGGTGSHSVPDPLPQHGTGDRSIWRCRGGIVTLPLGDVVFGAERRRALDRALEALDGNETAITEVAASFVAGLAVVQCETIKSGDEAIEMWPRHHHGYPDGGCSKRRFGQAGRSARVDAKQVRSKTVARHARPGCRCAPDVFPYCRNFYLIRLLRLACRRPRRGAWRSARCSKVPAIVRMTVSQKRQPGPIKPSVHGAVTVSAAVLGLHAGAKAGRVERSKFVYRASGSVETIMIWRSRSSNFARALRICSDRRT